MFRVDADKLNELALKHRENYANAKPFPHIVIDNFFPEEVLENILSEYPKPVILIGKNLKTSQKRSWRTNMSGTWETIHALSYIN
jgi:hypothetical protein